MLHHFTSATLNRNTAYGNNQPYAVNPLTVWAGTLPWPLPFLQNDADRYEEWAVQSQENILREPAARPLVEKAGIALENYMHRLGEIRNAFYDPAGLNDEQKRKAHEVIDYFGMVMANSLMRGFPLNHQLVQHCLDRLQKIDPSPESAAHDCASMRRVGNTRLPEGTKVGDMMPDGAIYLGMSPDIINDLQSIRNDLREIEFDVINSYSKLGIEIFPKDDNDVSYKHLKMLQLIKLDGPYARVPDPEPGVLKEFRENMADYTLTTLQAATKLTAPALQQRISRPKL